jgi:hypothetical protein
MDVIDLSFIVLLIITLLSTTKSTFLVWGIILILGYVVLKFLFFREYMANPSSTRLAQVNADIAYLKSIGLTETSNNETMKARVAERTRLTATPTTPSSSRLAQVNADIAYLKSVGLTETSDNETMKARVAERARLEQTATPPVSTPLRDQPATPPAPQLPPVPAMKCSIENFGSI